MLGGGSFGTAMAAHVANRKAQLEVNMLVRDPEVCQSINDNRFNWWVVSSFQLSSLVKKRHKSTFFVFSLLSKYFPEHKLPENVIATTDAKTALLGADYCLHAVPVQVCLHTFLSWHHTNMIPHDVLLLCGVMLFTMRFLWLVLHAVATFLNVASCTAVQCVFSSGHCRLC